MNMKDPAMAKYVEHHISFNDMRAFVCENSDDMNLFMDILREQQKLKVNAVIIPSGIQPEHLRPRQRIDKYK